MHYNTMLSSVRNLAKLKSKKSREHPQDPAILAVAQEGLSAESSSSAGEYSTPHGYKNKTDMDLLTSCVFPQGIGEEHVDSEWARIDGLEEYGVSKTRQVEHLKAEFTRLLQSVEGDHALQFNDGLKLELSPGDPPQDFADSAFQILNSLAICGLDTQVLYLEHCDRLVSDSQFRGFYNSVKSQVDRLGDADFPSKANKSSLKVQIAIINYVTAVIARLCIKSIGLPHFPTSCIANLATMSLKMKVLARNPACSLDKSLGMAENAADRREAAVLVENQGLFGHKPIVTAHMDKNWAKEYELAAKDGFLTGDAADHRRWRHYRDLQAYRSGLFDLITSTLRSFAATSRRGAAHDLFQITSLVFGTGFFSHPTLLSQDGRGELGASSHPHCLQVCYHAFQMLKQTSEAVSNKKEFPSSPGNGKPGWALSWRFATADSKPSDEPGMSLYNPDNLLSVMVPLLCCTAEFARTIAGMLYAASSLDEMSGGVIELSKNVKFEALATLEMNGASAGSPSKDLDTSSLSSSMLAQQALFCNPPSHVFGDKQRVRNDLGDRDESNKSQKARYLEIAQRMQSWIIDQAAVIVPCEIYVWTVATLCGLLVAGGLVLGTTVEDRLKGVDPFNITLFTWIFAVFVAAVAKSMKVDDWSWRNVLKRRCVCRSVSELAAASGVDPQDIIVYLLHNEATTILQVKGPFDETFCRRASDGKNGFAIDVKPTLRTLMQSGVVLVKVSTMIGPRLVALHVTKGTMYERMQQSNHFKGEDSTPRIMCDEVPPAKGPDDQGKGKKKSHRGYDKKEKDFAVSIVKLPWHRIFGIYDSLDSTFG